MDELRKYRVWKKYYNEKIDKYQVKDYEIVEAYSMAKALEIMKKKYPECKFSVPIWIR
jgi:hypothetical protein